MDGVSVWGAIPVHLKVGKNKAAGFLNTAKRLFFYRNPKKLI